MTKRVAVSDEEKAKCHFSFASKGGVQPKGFEEMSLKENVGVLVKGKLTSISTEWGKSFTVEMKSCEILSGIDQRKHMKDLLKD